jgi:hypothetical protein
VPAAVFRNGTLSSRSVDGRGDGSKPGDCRDTCRVIYRGSIQLHVNLTTNGPVDWVHWGTFTEFAPDRKAGVSPVIGDYTSFGGTAAQGPFRYTDNFNGYSWSDGMPHAAITNPSQGVYEIGRNNGLQFTVPADTTQRVLKVYVGAFAAKGTFTASLSDGSATSYSNSALDNLSNGPGWFIRSATRPIRRTRFDGEIYGGIRA